MDWLFFPIVLLILYLFVNCNNCIAYLMVMCKTEPCCVPWWPLNTDECNELDWSNEQYGHESNQNSIFSFYSLSHFELWKASHNQKNADTACLASAGSWFYELKDKKANLSLYMPWRHVGTAEIELHSFLNLALDTGECSVPHTGPLNPQGIDPSIGGWVGSRDSLDVFEKSKISCTCQESNHDSCHPACSLVTMKTMLSRANWSTIKRLSKPKIKEEEKVSSSKMQH
jgi:hypothetical protein